MLRGGRLCAAVSALLLLLSVTVLYSRLGIDVHRIDELDIVEEDQGGYDAVSKASNEEEILRGVEMEDGVEADQSRVSGFYFDHVVSMGFKNSGVNAEVKEFSIAYTVIAVLVAVIVFLFVWPDMLDGINLGDTAKFLAWLGATLGGIAKAGPFFSSRFGKAANPAPKEQKPVEQQKPVELAPTEAGNPLAPVEQLAAGNPDPAPPNPATPLETQTQRPPIPATLQRRSRPWSSTLPSTVLEIQQPKK